jgi:hypothetical protein
MSGQIFTPDSLFPGINPCTKTGGPFGRLCSTEKLFPAVIRTSDLSDGNPIFTRTGLSRLHREGMTFNIRIGEKDKKMNEEKED